MIQNIEYFYAAHSAFAYLGSKRLGEIARASNRQILHRPVDLRRVIDSAVSAPFRERSPAHRAYFFGREIKRWAEYRNAPVLDGRPTHHDNDIALPNCALIAAVEKGLDIDTLAHVFLEAHWRDDADLADETTLIRLSESAGINSADLIIDARSAHVQAIYEANTALAIERSVFGSPTYFVDGDMFYGQDRLEMVERALRQPFS